MTIGLAASHANGLLDVYRGTTFTGITVYIKLHLGDPGAAGTANASAVTTRRQASFSAASGGSIALSAAPTAWNMTATEALTHISLWDDLTAGNFLRSVALASTKNVVNLDTFTLSTLTLAYTPIAA